jgi:hypothetical protein
MQLTKSWRKPKSLKLVVSVDTLHLAPDGKIIDLICVQYTD